MSNSTVTLTSSGTTSQTTINTPSTSPPPTTSVVTSSVIASSAPQSTQVFTSVITQPASGTSSLPPETVVITSVSSPTETTGTSATDTSSTSSSTSSAVSAGQNKGNGGEGLSAGGKTAIAVVIPIIVVALLAIAAIFLWRRHKQRKSEEEQRKKEMEEYGYNPNHDPTLPAVAATDEIAEDTNGYRGWGTATSAGRKTSTTMTSGHGQQLSDKGYSPGSPTQGTMSDQNSGEPLVGQQRSTSDSMGALGAAPLAANNRNGDIRRGPSNASSSYSAGDHSNHSADAPIPVNSPQDYYTENAYYQPGPYDNPYGAQGGQPVIRDNPARRNTRIQETPYPHQGGIAQNF